jgi:SAM-dependent methyltransferase
MRILELGCGNKKGCGCPYKGEITGVDADPKSQADVIWNLEKFPYPFKDSEFDAVYSHHCVEHLGDTLKVMEEIARITKPHGKVTMLVPYGKGRLALGNVTHKKFFSAEAINSVAGFNQKIKVLKSEYHLIHRGFPELQNWKGRLLRQLATPIDFLINLNPGLYERIGLFPADEIEWELEVVK